MQIKRKFLLLRKLLNYAFLKNIVAFLSQAWDSTHCLVLSLLNQESNLYAAYTHLSRRLFLTTMCNYKHDTSYPRVEVYVRA